MVDIVFARFIGDDETQPRYTFIGAGLDSLKLAAAVR